MPLYDTCPQLVHCTVATFPAWPTRTLLQSGPTSASNVRMAKQKNPLEQRAVLVRATQKDRLMNRPAE